MTALLAATAVSPTRERAQSGRSQSGRASERDIERGGCEVGRGREEGRVRVARVRAVIIRRLQEIVDGERFCVQRGSKSSPTKKKVDDTCVCKKKNSRREFVCKEHPKRSEDTHYNKP